MKLKDFKYAGKNKSRFRIVKLSDKKFRVDYKFKLFCFIPIWDTKLCSEHHSIWYTELIFDTQYKAYEHIRKASRKLIRFKRTITNIYI